MPKRSSGSAAAFWVLCSPGGARTPCLSLPGPTSPLIAGHLPGMLHQSFPSLGSPLCASCQRLSQRSVCGSQTGGCRASCSPKERPCIHSARNVVFISPSCPTRGLCLHPSYDFPSLFFTPVINILSLPCSQFSLAPISPALRRREIEDPLPLYAPSVARRTSRRTRIQRFCLPRPMSDVSLSKGRFS